MNQKFTCTILGIASKLSYLKEIGITGTWLSPIFDSPRVDNGYDISDYRKVHTDYGTIDDFKALVTKCKEIGIKLILDFVPNHTSDKHEWFIKSALKDPDYINYYVWEDPIILGDGTRKEPTNWLSEFRYSSWEWHAGRQQYYLHQFAKAQPDLNYREPKVVEEMKEVLRYWLDLGVDGFRIDAVPYLFEKAKNSLGKYDDEPLSNNANCPDPTRACYLNHIYTQNQPETFDMAYQWRAVLDEYRRAHNTDVK